MKKINIVLVIVLSTIISGANFLTVEAQTTSSCPNGYICFPIVQVAGCPTGYACVPSSSFATPPVSSSVAPAARTGTGTTFSNGYFFGTESYTSGTGYSLSGGVSAGTVLTSTSPVGPIGGGACTALSSDLQLGSAGSEVTSLQNFLLNKGFDIPSITSGSASKGYFGYQTATAVTKFQSMVGLPQTGYVDAATRAKINPSCGSAPTSTGTYTPPTASNTSPTITINSTTRPVITALSANTASPGQSVTVYGYNFEHGMGIIFTGGTFKQIITPTSLTATQIVFTLPPSTAGYTSGAYTITVGSSGGNSDPRPITINLNTVTSTTYVQPISASLAVSSKCVTPGTNITFVSTVTGDGITSKTLQKDTNSDGIYGDVASWGAGAGTNTYTSNESPSYSGDYSLRLMVNGTERARQNVRVSSACAQTTTTNTQTTAPVTGYASVTATPAVVNSGGVVTLSFGRPSNAVASKVFLACPAGVSVPLSFGTNFCNVYNDMGISQNFTFTVTNSSGSVKEVPVTFQVYTADNPNYATGVSTQFTVNP